jgi:hypothetical protein
LELLPGSAFKGRSAISKAEIRSNADFPLGSVNPDAWITIFTPPAVGRKLPPEVLVENEVMLGGKYAMNDGASPGLDRGITA